MSRIIWSPDRGWHDNGSEARVALDPEGRLRSIPVEDVESNDGQD